MSDFQAKATVDVDHATLFAYVSQVQNLPEYFARMTSARPGDGEEVHTTAQMPDGQQVEGDAWFRVEEVQQGLVDTVLTIKRLVEQQDAAG